MCNDCEKLERRVRDLESLQPSGWGIAFRFLLVVFIIPAMIHTTLWSMDQRAQIWAQHPDWTTEQVRVEVWRRVGWDDFSIFTYRPLADKK